jgi:hypothetical protein
MTPNEYAEKDAKNVGVTIEAKARNHHEIGSVELVFFVRTFLIGWEK